LKRNIVHEDPATLVGLVGLVGAAESPLNSSDDQASWSIVSLASVGNDGLPGGADGVGVEFVPAYPWTIALCHPPAPPGCCAEPRNEGNEDGVARECVVVCGE
jgi:hypothetical protein